MTLSFAFKTKSIGEALVCVKQSNMANCLTGSWNSVVFVQTWLNLENGRNTMQDNKTESPLKPDYHLLMTGSEDTKESNCTSVHFSCLGCSG